MMAMEINGNFSGCAAGKQTYGSHLAQGMSGSGAAGVGAINGTRGETEKTRGAAGESRAKNTAEYANELAKLVPSAEFKVGTSFSTAKSGITLTVDPRLLEKMQKDPEKEKEMKELIKGVESAVNLLENINKASGWTVVYKHCYIDENGKFRSNACLRNDFMLNMSDKLREERRKNSEKLIQKIKEKAAEQKKKSEETLEEKREALTNRADAGFASNKAQRLIYGKIAASKDGKIYLDDRDMRTIIKAARKDSAGKTAVKNQAQVGAKLDLRI